MGNAQFYIAGTTRINNASWFALFVSFISVFTIRFGVGHGGSIWYAVSPTLLTLPMFAWSLAGYWNCPKRMPMFLALVGICGTFMAALTALVSLNDGDATPVMFGLCMSIGSRVLTGHMVDSPILTQNFDRLD